MNKLLLCIILYIVSVILQFFFSRNIIISIDLLSSLISVFSILFGFYIVALSIFATSKFVSTLYSDEVKDKKGFKITNLHILLDRYQFGLILNLVSIFYFLFLIFLSSHKNTVLFKIFFYFVVPLVIHNFISVYSSLNQLIKIIKQDAKMSKNK